MTEFGVLLAATEHTVQPVELARLLESAGFDAVFVGEHTHLPLAEHRYSNIGDEYKQLYDPFIFLTAAGSPKYMEWYGAFGIMVTLVWLYLEFLRLFAKLRS